MGEAIVILSFRREKKKKNAEYLPRTHIIIPIKEFRIFRICDVM